MVPSDDRSLLGLVDSVALVTGAGAGIGRASALLLARAGCHVVVADIDDDLAAGTVDQIEALGRRATVVRADVREPAGVRSMLDQARAALGPVDVAVNMVGGSRVNKPLLDISPQEWHAVVDANLTSAFLCCQAEALAMIEDRRPGRIVNVASAAGITAAPNISPYGAAKAGVIQFTKSAALEFAPFGIRVNCVVPGTFATERIQSRLTDPATPEGTRAFFAAAAATAPLGRLGDPAEAAGVVLFLASGLSSYMTGQSVVTDGGSTLTSPRPPVGGPMAPSAVSRTGRGG